MVDVSQTLMTVAKDDVNRKKLDLKAIIRGR